VRTFFTRSQAYGPCRTPIRREWWWEREWRKVGHLDFALSDIVAVLAPEAEHSAFDDELVKALRNAELGQPPRPMKYLDSRGDKNG
jgi:hypothetical protein